MVTQFKPRSTRAFTLLELLVVIGIVGVLVALLLPAVQRVRDAAARTQCANNMHQIGLAAHQYHGTDRAFPAGMRWQGGQDPYRMMSWLNALLPFVEQDALHQESVAAYAIETNPFINPPHTGLAAVVPTFLCPADWRTAEVQVAQRQLYRVGLTNFLGVSGLDLDSLDGVLYRDSQVRIAEITDGTSQTLFAGERPPSADFQFGWWYAGGGQRFTGSGDMILGVREKNMITVTVGSCAPGSYDFSPGRVDNQCDMFHFWSLHSGGANFLFVDGSVHFLAYSSVEILPALASRAGGESPDLEY